MPAIARRRRLMRRLCDIGHKQVLDKAGAENTKNGGMGGRKGAMVSK